MVFSEHLILYVHLSVSMGAYIGLNRIEITMDCVSMSSGFKTAIQSTGDDLEVIQPCFFRCEYPLVLNCHNIKHWA